MGAPIPVGAASVAVASALGILSRRDCKEADGKEVEAHFSGT